MLNWQERIWVLFQFGENLFFVQMYVGVHTDRHHFLEHIFHVLESLLKSLDNWRFYIYFGVASSLERNQFPPKETFSSICDIFSALQKYWKMHFMYLFLILLCPPCLIRHTRLSALDNPRVETRRGCSKMPSLLMSYHLFFVSQRNWLRWFCRWISSVSQRAVPTLLLRSKWKWDVIILTTIGT